MDSVELAKHIRGRRWDLEKLLDAHGQAKMRFFVSAPAHAIEGSESWFPAGVSPPTLPEDADDAFWTNLYENISTAVDSIRSSYLAPGLQLNNYLESTATDLEWEETKYDLAVDAPRPSNMLRRVRPDVYAASVLLAIKSGLDRLVRIFSFYFKGIAPHTTWGRYRADGVPSGFMTVVAEGKLGDGFLHYLHDAYGAWIQAAVAPRDALIHYRDAESRWHFLAEERALTQTHVVTDADGTDSAYGLATLCDYVENWYRLADFALLTLASRLPNQPRKVTHPLDSDTSA
jgi:hypothetical protein